MNTENITVFNLDLSYYGLENVEQKPILKPKRKTFIEIMENEETHKVIKRITRGEYKLKKKLELMKEKEFEQNYFKF